MQKITSKPEDTFQIEISILGVKWYKSQFRRQYLILNLSELICTSKPQQSSEQECVKLGDVNR